jgi:copper chaperone CopZ
MKSSIWTGIGLAAAVVALTILGPTLARELASRPRASHHAAGAGARVVTLEVGGMTCKGCSARVREELESVPGVSAVEVRLSDRRATIVCATSVDDSALVSAVHRAGRAFTATPTRD